MNRNRNNPAFTLIEMLVALMMIAMIVSMVYGSYAATSQSLQVYDSRLTCEQRAELALRLMARQIRCAYAPAEPNEAKPIAEAAHESLPVFLGNAQEGRGEMLTLLTTAGLAGSPTTPQRLAVTRYRYDRVSGALSICNDSEVDESTPRQWQLLLDNVERIDLTFYDGRQWQPQWDYKHTHKLPRAVRIEMAVSAKDGREYELATTASVGYRATTPGRQK